MHDDYTSLCGILYRRSIYTPVNSGAVTNARAAAVPRRLKFSADHPEGLAMLGIVSAIGMREMRRRGYFPRYKAGLYGTRRDSSSEFLILTRTFFAVHRDPIIYI